MNVRFENVIKKCCYVHQFTWEYCKGLIPDGYVIDHVTDNKKNNRLSNLPLITEEQNCKKNSKKS